jgi:hypothetical protein
VSTADWYRELIGRFLFGDATQEAPTGRPEIEDVVRRLHVVAPDIDDITEQYAMAA